jgi:hypothetical protein
MRELASICPLNADFVADVITEFASHPPANRHVHRERNSLQRLAGTWLSDFAKRCRQSEFSLVTYLAELQLKADPFGWMRGHSEAQVEVPTAFLGGTRYA